MDFTFTLNSIINLFDFNIFLSIILGIFFGFITGFTPGLHVNNIVSLLLLNFNFLSKILNFNNYNFSIFIISLAITHTITEIFPTALLGVPDNNTFVSLLPIHKLFLKGKAYKAIVISIFSSYIGGVLTILLFLFSKKIIFLLNIILYEKNVIFILILILLFLAFYNFSFKSFFTIIFSSILGFLSLKFNLIMPLLSGLFGMPVLFESLKNKNSIVKQNLKLENFFNKIFFKEYFKIIFFSLLLGIIFSYLPGTGTSIASFFLILLFPKIKSESIIASNSSISTINFIFSIYTFYYNNKSRNGAILGVKKIMPFFSQEYFFKIVLLSLLILTLTTLLSLLISKKIIFLFSKLNLKQYKKITIIIILLNFFIAFISNNILGIIFLTLSSILGYFALKNKIEKVKLLSCLITPTISLKL